MDDGTLAFRERAACPCCGATAHTSVWNGRFSDPEVTDNIANFHYSSDTGAALGDQPFDLVQCNSCKMLYHRLVLTDAGIPIVYSEWTNADQVARFEADHGRADEFAVGIFRTKLILRINKLLAGRFQEPFRLLDFGCGDGETIAQAAMFGFEAAGIDVSRSRIETAGINKSPIFPDLERFDRDGGGKVHAIILEQVLEHLMEPRDILVALGERLLPGGILYIAVPDCTGITVPRDFAAFHRVQPVEHVNAFTPNTLATLVENAGFRRLRWPSVFVSEDLSGAMRTMAGMALRRQNTEQFFRYDG
tara:strand:- start:455 stop:1369 length:915 start_codon:yes stop_codon:yes gene_type:complete